MSDWPACDAALQQSQESGDPWGYCTGIHCDEVQNYNHQYCNCTGQFSHLKVNGVCPFGNGSLVPIGNPGCYCCCSCFAYDTPIAVTDNTFKAIQDFVINDPVLVAEGADLNSWVQKPVLFSSGTGALGSNKLIKIHFGDQTKGVTVTPESFVSQFVDKNQSLNFYNILSTDPNNYIDVNGLVNLQMVKNANVFAFSRLLGTSTAVAQGIYDILNSDTNYLLVTAIQPFLMKDGTLKQAQKLVPGKDELVLADGSTTPLISLEVGMFKRGVHHIATTTAPAESLEGHLILTNGIVSGDYALQISLESEEGAVEDAHKDAPTFGTREYIEQHTHLTGTAFSAYSVVTDHKADSFEALHPDKSEQIPDDGFSYITKAQAEELLNCAPIFPASNNGAERGVRYLFSLFGGFYPDVTFYYDQHNMTPNAYAFKQYDRKFIVVSGGWTLVEGLYFQGLAMTIAYLINAVDQTDSQSTNISPTAKWDYDVYPIFLSIYFFAADAVKNYNLGLNQIKTVFGHIKDNRNPPDRISLDCRLQTLEASIAGLPLPHCAGGPPDPALEVVNVSADFPETSKKPVVTIEFNMPVDTESATAIANYTFDPAATAFSAAVSEDDPKTVNLVAEIEPETEYVVVASGVLSVDRQPLIPDKSGGKFTLSGSN